MLGYLKYAGAGLLVAAFLISLWIISGWRADAMQMKEAKKQADDAKAELSRQIERTVKADRERLSVEERMRAVQEAWAKKVGTTIKVIREHAPNNPDCSVIPDDVASQLSVLREGQR